MSVHVQWDSEDQTTILWSFVGRWTWGEYEDALGVATAMMDSVDHQIDYIFDVRHMSILPPDLVTRVKAKYLNQPEKIRYFIAVGFDRDLQLVWDTFTDLPYARHLKAEYADSLEDARDMLAGRRAAD